MGYILIAVIIVAVCGAAYAYRRHTRKDTEMYMPDIPDKKEVEPSEPKPMHSPAKRAAKKKAKDK